LTSEARTTKKGIYYNEPSLKNLCENKAKWYLKENKAKWYLKDNKKQYKDHIIHHLDINRCRKNQLFYSKYDYPLFTVMDEPVIYTGLKKAGYYAVETDCYIPLRGNGWYLLPEIEYCLSIGLISESDIKFAVYSSLTVPCDHYCEFIKYLYSVLDSEAKMSVNSLIGMFKPKLRENWKSLLITDQPNVAFHHYMDKKGCFIDHRQIGDRKFYQVFNKFTTEKDETEAPIYNQILGLEAIEVHKLMTIIKSKGGIPLDISTDCVNCVFPDNQNPFTMSDGLNIDGYYFDDEQKVPKYKLEDKEGRLLIERLSNYVRKDTYHIKEKKMTVFEDVKKINSY
jgi:hypothetical protein